jgi:RNA polymerase sigma-70 factor (ECF subfamily)
MAKQDIKDYIQQWLAGDEFVFGQVLDFYYPKLLASSLKIVPVREDAEELVMNALLKIWQYRHRLSEVRQFDDYLFGILRQEVVRLSRKQVLIIENIDHFALNELGTVEHPELIFKEFLSRYHAALDKLSPKQREVFLSLREHDMSRKEIAEKTGLSVHTVNSHMNTALKILRQEMKEYPEVLVGILISSSLYLW